MKAKVIVIICLLLLLTTFYYLREFRVFGSETCPQDNGWTKVDSDDLSQYPVQGATEYCFKAGSPKSKGCIGGIFDSWPQQGEGKYCGLSHWSFFIPQPSPTPTATPEPSETPTTSPSSSPTSQPTNTPEKTVEPTTTPTATPQSTPTATPNPTSNPSTTIETTAVVVTPEPTVRPCAQFTKGGICLKWL